MAFDICHALDCKKGGLITVRLNEIYDGVADLASKAFTIIHMRNDPKIYIGCAMSGGKDNIKWSRSKDKGELKEDLLIIDL